MKYDNERRFIIETVKEVGENILKRGFETSDFSAYVKHGNDIVTSCDLEAEQYIVSRIASSFPGDQVISEEMHFENSLGRERTWVLDPLDGTKNFSRGIPLFGIQMAFIERAQAVVSAIYLPIQDELYHAVRGKGAYCNGQRIHVASIIDSASAVVSFGDFSRRKEAERIRDTQVEVISHLAHSVNKLKMFGASSIDLSFLSAGRSDAHIMFTKNYWDILPGYLLAIEAGAYTNYHESHRMENILFAATKELYEKLLILVDSGHTTEVS